MPRTPTTFTVNFRKKVKLRCTSCGERKQRYGYFTEKVPPGNDPYQVEVRLRKAAEQWKPTMCKSCETKHEQA